MRTFVFVAFLLLSTGLHAALLGERVLALQTLPDSLSYPPPQYTALVDSLSSLLRASLPREATPRDYLLAFSTVTRTIHGTGTRPDILALDLRDRALDCSSLAILLRDVTAVSRADSLYFVVSARHLFVTDGLWDYDPLAGTCTPAEHRIRTAMEVEGGDTLMLSLSARAMGEWLSSEQYDKAVEWFRVAQAYPECDALLDQAWGEVARLAGDTEVAEAHFRLLQTTWPDTAQANYALARFLVLQERIDEGRYYAQIAVDLAVLEGNPRIKLAAEALMIPQD